MCSSAWNEACSTCRGGCCLAVHRDTVMGSTSWLSPVDGSFSADDSQARAWVTVHNHDAPPYPGTPTHTQSKPYTCVCTGQVPSSLHFQQVQVPGTWDAACMIAVVQLTCCCAQEDFSSACL